MKKSFAETTSSLISSNSSNNDLKSKSVSAAVHAPSTSPTQSLSTSVSPIPAIDEPLSIDSNDAISNAHSADKSTSITPMSTEVINDKDKISKEQLPKENYMKESQKPIRSSKASSPIPRAGGIPGGITVTTVAAASAIAVASTASAQEALGLTRSRGISASRSQNSSSQKLSSSSSTGSVSGLLNNQSNNTSSNSLNNNNNKSDAVVGGAGIALPSPYEGEVEQPSTIVFGSFNAVTPGE